MTSVNTNYGALLALQSLNRTTEELDVVQSRINTGLKVATAKDNGAVFAIAEGLRTRVSALSSVSAGIDRVVNVIDTALAAGSSVSDVLKQLKEKAVAAQAADLNSTQRAALQTDFAALLDQINKIVGSATFNGANLVNGTNLTGGANQVRALVQDTVAASSALVETLHGTPGATTANATATTRVSDLGTVQVGDWVRFDLTGATNSAATDFQIQITEGLTIADFVAAVNSAGVSLTASFDEATRTISYDRPGAAAGDTVSVTINTDKNGLGVARTGGGAAQLAVGVAAANTVTSATAAVYVSAPVARGSTVVANFGTVAANDYLRLAVGPAGGLTTYTVQITGATTVDQLVSSINTATAGRVTASYNDRTGTFDFRSRNATDTIAVTINSAQNGSGTARTSTEFAIGGASGDEANTTANSSSLDISGFDLRVGGSGALSAFVGLDISTSVASATAVSTLLDTAVNTVSANQATLGAQGKVLANQRSFLTKLSDNIENGIGQLVDADLGRESARLQALQIKQQLGAQALSIANQQPSILLSFFR